jgi:hypothetical protein
VSAAEGLREWLALRERADAIARAEELLAPLRARMNRGPVLIRDMGCGTGSMGRWLAGRLPGPQHWVLHDRDPDLLAVARVAGVAADGSPVTFETRRDTVTALHGTDLAGTGLVTVSALLDVLTFAEVDGLAAACAEAACPALLTLSVTGKVEFTPADPLDAEFAAAFNAHQRRGRRLGPDAVAVATRAFERRGVTVLRRPSPWRLGPEDTVLAGQWLREWVGAACEARPELAGGAQAYLRRRLAAVARLRVEVGHADLLAIGGPA